MSIDDDIREASEAIALVPAADDPRLYDLYLKRARARFAWGEGPDAVYADLCLAGRCAASQGGVRLLKFEPHRVRPRRLDPLHLSLLVPEPPLVERCAEVFGLPLLSFFAKTATSDVVNEVRALSSVFRTGALDGPADLQGLGVATYAAALGLIASGDKRAAGALLVRYDRSVDARGDLEPPPAARRYLNGIECLSALKRRDVDGASSALNRVAAQGSPDEPLDLMVLGLVAVATLETVELPTADLGPSAGVADAVLRAWAEVD